MTDLFALRRDFMSRFDMTPPSRPEPDLQALAMWQTMLEEESAELAEALARYRALDGSESTETRIGAMAELCAEGVDLLNVVTGLLLSQGLPLEAMTRAIHTANLAKCVDGHIVRRADGKILKPEGWQPADKTGVIRASLDQSG